MILHIPHASTIINGLVGLQDEKANLDLLTDTRTDELFGENEYTTVIFPYSRFVCDVERLKDDPMSTIGQGIIYTRDAFNNDIIRNISNNDTLAMWDYHHNRLNMAVNRYLTLFHKCIIIDCHSFTAQPDEVDICIGTQYPHTPWELVEIIRLYLTKRGYTIGINNPYSGTIIPTQHKGNENVYSIMIEVNKNVYMNGNFDKARQDIQGVLKEIETYEDSFDSIRKD